MMRKVRPLYPLLFVLLSIQAMLFGQSIDRPMIWATDSDKAEMLNRMEQYEWARTVKNQAKNIVDGNVNAHINSPVSILNTIPAFASDDNLTEAQASTANGKHATATRLASYSAMLYYLTGEEKYAQFSADIISHYIEAWENVAVDKLTASGSHFYDARTTYGHFAIAYDFIYDFLTKEGTQVYLKSSGEKVDFDNVKAQRVIEKLASNALGEHKGADNHGKVVSNHPILTAPGALFCVLCVDDDAERERLFNVFWYSGTKEQNSFKNTILPMFGDQGIWPESLSYSFMPSVTMVLNTIDRYKPEMDVTSGYKYILEGNFLFDYLRTPNRYFVRFGDSKRKIDQTGSLYRYTLDIAKRRGYTDLENKAKVALRQGYSSTGGYNPVVSTSTFNAFSAFPHLFWGVEVPSVVDGAIDFNKPTVVLKHAGIALQRNYVEQNNKQYGLCGIIGGAHYVHSHVTGITMELYGQGVVMGPNAGLSASLAERKLPEHTDYFRLYAGNNTVIVNGTSRGIQSGAWNSNSYLWMNTTVNVAAEPAHLEDPISDQFSFATQFLDDNVNNCDQQRTLSTIRTSETTAYYFDMFRSNSLTENKFHDYIYHNIGDEIHISDNQNREISVSPTTKYQTYYSDPVKSPGWRFFENTEHTASTNKAVNIRFDLNEFGKYMHLLTPEGVTREYTKAVGPPTREGESGYLDKNTPIIAIRQQGEAWESPFVHIFEPSSSTTSSVKQVKHLYHGERIIGAKVSSEIGNKTVEDYILCLPDAKGNVTLAEYGISFTGRFAVVRYEQDLEEALTTLYIGEGDSLTYGDITLSSDDSKKAVKEVVGEPYFGRQLLFKNLSSNEIFPKGTNLSVEAIVGEEYLEATLWMNDTLSLGTKTSAPYIWSGHEALTDMQAEEYVLTLKAKDSNGVVEEETIIVGTPGQDPYTDDGNPHPVPGKIQFEDYDLGGQNLGFYDLSEQDNFYAYRDTDLVDLGRNGSVVSFAEPGEWLEYTVDVKQTDVYKLSIRHSTTGIPSVKGFSVIMPEYGDTVLKNCETLYTGRGSYYEDEVGAFFLNSGEQIIRINIENEGVDLDYMQLETVSNAYGLQIEAENGMVSVDQDKAYYSNGDKLALTAIPEDGYVFTSWTGSATSTDNPLDLTFNGSHIFLKANFEKANALSEVSSDVFKISPNPTNGNFVIALTSGLRATFTVYHLNGTVVSSGLINSQRTMQLNHLKSGIYLLEVKTNTGRQIQRLVIQ